MGYARDIVFQAVQKICCPAMIEPILVQAWAHWRGQSPKSIQVRPNLIYYRPGDRARVVTDVIVTLADETAPITLQFFFNVFADGAAVNQQVAESDQLAVPPQVALPVFAIEAWQTVVWTLPHAPCLPELNNLLQPEYFCPLLISLSDLPTQVEDYPAPQLFRYVPFKRAILTWHSPKTDRRYFVKLCTEAEFPQVVDHFRQLHQIADRLSFAVPEVVAADVATRTVSMRALPGEQFTKIMAQLRPATFSQVGQILAELHHADLMPTRGWSAAKELKTAGKAMAEVKLALPHLSKAIDQAIGELTAKAGQIVFSRNYPIHANLFGDQILYTPQRLGMVDWDTLSLGDPHYDLGRLVAHLIYLAGCNQWERPAVKACITALLASYAAAIDWAIDPTCLAWHITLQLLLRGKISSLRKLPEHWPEHLEFVVAEAQCLLLGRSEFVTLPAIGRQVQPQVQPQS
ncbi:MAG: aminoglycoside phosphotransferase family protein [Synechococcales cyanobacterium CRU_2_2]|nr:aminoglycoside phosphotransferase family protein [Synechococcales cyanobacterium CRU_2_2]